METLIDWIVAPVDQRYELNEVVVLSISLLPEHMKDEPVMTGVGFGTIVTVLLDVPVHPTASVTVTVYVFADETEIV